MSVWEWVDLYQWKVAGQRDNERLRLLPILQSALQQMSDEPHEALDLLEHGRDLAEQLHEPWWEMLYIHWMLQVMIHHTRDFHTAAGLAPAAVETVEQSLFERLPQRVCMQEDLIATYLGIDPHGHADRIRAAIALMEQQVKPGIECSFCVREMRIAFLTERGELETALSEAQTYLEHSESEGYHYLSNAYYLLCEIAFRRGDSAHLWEWAHTGVAATEHANKHYKPVFLAWLAFVHRQMLQDPSAQRFYTAAIEARGVAIPARGYYDALAAYHELATDWEQALEIRDQELEAIRGHGMLYREAMCRLARCRLMSRLDQPLADEVRSLREVALQMPDPQPVMDAIAALEV